MTTGYRNIALGIIFTIITCGIYNLFWNWQQMKTCNELLGREEFNPPMVILLSLVTCGLYFIYYQYCMGGVIVEIQRARSVPPFENLPILSLLLSLFGLSIIVDAIHQNELNKFYPQPA
ncbi:MAG TPA: hypothetical protein DCZ92_07270 [Elusimicrobia bacterium]|nr:MAG: hypothetical protein A2016_02735 [Elusimicrobia bacterium GWF2_62_30]HBA60606.1 hypothetical protein [Elusimicrobiota bacterium]